MDAKTIGTLPLLSLSTLVITGCITTDVRSVESQEIQGNKEATLATAYV